MDTEPIIPEPVAGRPEFVPPPLGEPGRPGDIGKASKRRSNHIVRHYREPAPVIPVSTRVARPITVNTTPEQARQAAVIASAAFKPIVPPPTNPTGPTPLDGQGGQIGGVPLDETVEAAEPQTNKVLLALVITLSLIVVAAIAGFVGYYLAKH